MIWWYRLLFVPVVLLLAPYSLWRMRRRGGYRENFGQRFGAHPRRPDAPPGQVLVWLQAVSVGEVMAVGPLLQELRRAGAGVYLTTTTSTGYRLARERHAGLTTGIGYFPLDWWWFSARAWRRIQPDLALVVEGERWPEHLHQARRRGVAAITINARISERSFRRWRAFLPVARWNLGQVTHLLCASALDRQRLRELGAPAERLTVTGNLKLDVTIPRLAAGELAGWRARFGLPSGPVIVGASTWPGEEAALVAALLQARRRGRDCSLVLVPRHAERRGELAAELARHPVRWALRTAGPPAGGIDVLVVDTTGELREWLQLGDVVFVGKSLPPHTEGQTPVEAAVLGRAILLGPGMKNFRTIARELLDARAALPVATPGELASRVGELLDDPAARAALGAAAVQWHAANQGAVARTLAALQPFLRPAPR